MAVDLPAQIERANDIASAAEDDLRALISDAQTAASGVSSANAPTTIVAPIVAAPPFTPATDLSGAFQSDFDATWSDLEVWVRGLMADWMNTYFPTLNPNLGTSEDTWLLDVINNGYSGLPAAYEQAVWNRARSKDTLEALRMEEEAVAQFAARGFSLPPGVLANRLLQVQQEAANKSSTVARELAIKQMEIAVDMVKFAVGEVSKLRLGIAAALADFIRAWMAMPTAAADIAKAKAQMHQLLWTSSASYIQAQVAVANLSLDAQKTNAANLVEVGKFNASAFDSMTKVRVETALRSADDMAGIATAARGAQNTLVGAIEQAVINSNA